jgi:Major Facilitator Superfamily
VLTLEGVMHGLYLLWWVQEKHVPAPIVAAILAAGELAITVLEVPTGWLADRYGHRASLIVGSLTQTLGMVACWLGNGVPGILAACLLVALGDAFRSGADQALLYRSCAALDRSSEFQRREARASSVKLTALVAMTLAGGFIVAAWGFAAGWQIEALASVAGLLTAIAMVEPPPAIAANRDDSAASPAAPIPPAVFMLIAPVGVLGGMAAALSFVVQTTGTPGARLLTAIVAVITLAEACGAMIASYLPARPRLLVTLCALGGVVTLAGTAWPILLPVAAIALSLLSGVAEPLRAAAIQALVADTARARAASLASAADKALTTIGLAAAGLVGPSAR